MRRLFGAKKETAPAPTLEEANARMQGRGDTIDEKIKKLDAELARHRDAIKKTRPGPAQENAKKRAIQVLKQKRLYEGQRDQIYNQQFNLESVAFATQSMQDSAEQVQAMKAANKELKTAFKNKDLDIDEIDKLNDDMSDLMDRNQEIQDALGASYALPDEIDDEELMGELDALEADMGAEAESAGGVPSYLQEPEIDLDAPAAPTQTPEAPEIPAAQPAQPVSVDEFGLPIKN